MKKSEFRATARRMSEGDTPKGGWGRYLGNWNSPAGSKLARKAAKGKL